MASEQGKRFLDNDGVKQALVGLLTMGVTGGKGYPGLVRMQDKMKAAFEKLQEKMERRMEKLQTVLMQRSAAMAKVPTYTSEMAMLSSRLGNTEGGDVIMVALYKDPSQSANILKYISDVEGSTGYRLSGRGIVDAVTVLESGDAKLKEGFRTSADILESVKGDLILDNETYYQALADAMVTQPQTGYAIFDYDPVPKDRTAMINAQTKHKEERFGAYILDSATNQDQERQWWNPQTSQMEVNPYFDMWGSWKQDFDTLGAYGQEAERYYARKFVNETLTSGSSQFDHAFRMNPNYQRMLKLAYPKLNRQTLSELHSNPDKTSDFDAYMGPGAANIFMNIDPNRLYN